MEKGASDDPGHLEDGDHGADESLTPKVRGERTRRRIAESTLSLLVEREVPPTAQDIAKRAGVSLRLIFHHFEDLGSVHRFAGTLYAEHFGHLAPEVSPDLPLATRIARTVRLRAVLYESIGNLGRNATALTASHAGVAASVEVVRRRMVGFLEHTFAPELDAAGRDRKSLLGAIDVVTCWSAWDRMRRGSALSVRSAQRAMTMLLRAVLTAPT